MNAADIFMSVMAGFSVAALVAVALGVLLTLCLLAKCPKDEP